MHFLFHFQNALLLSDFFIYFADALPGRSEILEGAPSIEQSSPNIPPRVPSKTIPTPLLSVEPVLEDKTELITGYRKAMVKTMTEALRIPHFGYCDEIILNRLLTYVFLFFIVYHDVKSHFTEKTSFI